MTMTLNSATKIILIFQIGKYWDMRIKKTAQKVKSFTLFISLRGVITNAAERDFLLQS